MKHFKYKSHITFLNILLLSFWGCSDSHLEQKFIDNPSSLNSTFPRLFTDNTGTVHMSWIHKIGEVAQLRIATLTSPSSTEVTDELGWSAYTTVAKSDDWFVNWADFPSVIGLNSTPVATHWLDKVPGSPYSYHVKIQPIEDQDWSQKSSQANTQNNQIEFQNEAFVPHTDNTNTEHGFVSMQPVDSSTFYAIWLDGRNTSSMNHEDMDHNEYSMESDKLNTKLGTAMTLRGALLGRNGEIIGSHLIDEAVCDCCNTSLVKTDRGLIAAYRNRTNEEIRDLYVSRYENGLWDTPNPVHNDGWKIAACPVNGPQLAFHSGVTAALWFTGADNIARVKMAFSDDYGENFSTPILLSENQPLGRVDIVMHNEHSAWVSYVERYEDGARLHIKQVMRNGIISQSLILDDMEASRSSGFPQLTSFEDGLLVAWTELGERASTIRTSYIKGL
ncbi:MAG: hypothetical protein CL672_05940 [Balneola sp.]|nr:hypothetical protein [Balneola sp.]|tara:strand:+ start:13666 stop:15003 length:1338 start_codon:yes stop_codon:yes gene_type:complete